MLSGLGFRVWGLGFRAWGLGGFEAWMGPESLGPDCRMPHSPKPNSRGRNSEQHSGLRVKGALYRNLRRTPTPNIQTLLLNLPTQKIFIRLDPIGPKPKAL